MPRQFFHVFALLSIISCLIRSDFVSSRSFQYDNAQDTTSLISALNKEIPVLMEKALIPGLSIAVIKNGEVFWCRGFGVKNNETGEPVTENTVFEAASTSKPVFAYAVMRLVERGLLDLDTPLVNYAPISYLETVWDEYNTSDERLKQITTRLVLTHSSGFPNWLKDRLYFEFDPGDKWGYSGSGFVFLGTVIEKITGKSLELFINDEVLEPLGMTDSWFVWRDEFDELATDRHNFLGHVMPRFKYERPLAAGSLYTTAKDFSKFLLAIINNTGLSSGTMAELLKPQIRVSRNGKEIDDLFWGLGIGLNKTNQDLTFWHWGDNGDCKAYFEVSMNLKIGFVYFSNCSNGLSIVDDLLKVIIGNNVSALTKFGSYPKYDCSKIRLYNTYAKEGANAAATFIRNLHEEIDTGDTKGAVTSDVILSIVREAESMRDYEGALIIAEAGVQSFPESSTSHLCLGEAYLVNNMRKNAIKAIKKSIALDPLNNAASEALKMLEQD